MGVRLSSLQLSPQERYGVSPLTLLGRFPLLLIISRSDKSLMSWPGLAHTNTPTHTKGRSVIISVFYLGQCCVFLCQYLWLRIGYHLETAAEGRWTWWDEEMIVGDGDGVFSPESLRLKRLSDSTQPYINISGTVGDLSSKLCISRAWRMLGPLSDVLKTQVCSGVCLNERGSLWGPLLPPRVHKISEGCGCKRRRHQ